jgi:hypothetical protein
MKSIDHSFCISKFAAAFVLAFSLCVLCGESSAQDFKTIHPGVEYARVDHKLGIDPVKINLLRLDLTKVRLDVHHAFDKAIGVEPTSAIAKRHGAIAAINAGFFRLDNSEFAGDAAGVLVINGTVWSESQNNRVAIRIRNGDRRTEVFFDHLDLQTTLSYPSGQVLGLSGANRQRKAAEIIAYTPDFGERTLTDSLGAELIFRNCASSRRCEIALAERAGNSVIPKDGFVVSIGPNRSEEAAPLLAVAKSKLDPRTKRAELVYEFRGRPQIRLNSTDDITNGVPQLIKNGKIDITWEQEKAGRSFVEMRHPRTAVAKLKDGKFLMITVDGRQPGVSAGMTLQELAEYLFSLGATDAMNLDGGGSTTMFLDGKIVNTPSDKEGERKVSDAILVTLRDRKRPRH